MNKSSQKSQPSEEDCINFIQGIITEFEDTRYIYRGVNENHTNPPNCPKETRVNTGIYRDKRYKEIFKLHPTPFHIERDSVEKAKRLYPSSPSNIEILTDLRHLGGLTNLIDFSYSLYVALFFACNGEKNKNGELILYPIQENKKTKDINYTAYPNDIKIIEPKATGDSKNRVLFQSSVFIYAPKGYILLKKKKL